MNVSEIDAEYRAVYPKNSDRAAEIGAPLRVTCSLAKDAEMGHRLELALLRQRQKVLDG